MRQVTFETTYPPDAAHPLHQRLMGDGPVTRAELLIWGPTADVTTLTWFDAEPAAVSEALGAVDSATETRLVAADGGTYAFVRQSEYELPAAVLSAVADSRVAFVPPVTFRASGAARFEAVGESDALSEFYGELNAAFDTEVVRVREFRRWPEPARVTDRQREALTAAVAVGYYDVDRSGSVADVAAELDCAPSTAGELLRRAESAVLTAFVGES
ncbi:helix-turn-helix domain-containing protein [Halosimplex pelagicum]|uniref:Helix-turn-helix domain-containing protein n=1 Tax=Halosimplex pelagicum TaxID=869886 RepID=A0A7D5PE17_9EURY|nr:helix-turn-helix domain-containing protein [Halosimplex pelagicum]QLH84622.1 helix-turn-helix domain-containing protein [Halosimplex pelagicum]